MRQGQLIRVVLDVRRGAFYYIFIDELRFLFGVTMNQHAVTVADDKIRDVATSIEEFTGSMGDLALHPDRNPPPEQADRLAGITEIRPKHA